MKKILLKTFFCLYIIIICMVFVSCNNRINQKRNPDEENPYLNVPYTGQWIELTEHQLEMMKLEGGAEIETRKPNPISNSKLQQKYPNILALRGSLTDNKVALTFDDGPDPRYTPFILDILKQHNIKATFFLIGARAVGHESITKRIRDEGHIIGNHTYWHPNLHKEGVGRLNWEITQTEKALNDLVGLKPSLFRAPYGSLNEELVEKIGEMGYSAIGWSVDSLDWMQLTPEQIKNNVLSNIHPGAIILMHDGGNWTMDLIGTVQALNDVIKELQKDGIEFVTVPQLLNIRDRK